MARHRRIPFSTKHASTSLAQAVAGEIATLVRKKEHIYYFIFWLIIRWTTRIQPVSTFVTNQLPEESSYKDKDTDWKELTRPDTSVMANRMWIMGISLIMVEGGGQVWGVCWTHLPSRLPRWMGVWTCKRIDLSPGGNIKKSNFKKNERKSHYPNVHRWKRAPR